MSDLWYNKVMEKSSKIMQKQTKNKAPLNIEDAIQSKIKRLKDEELAGHTFSLELAADAFIQVYFSYAPEESLERIRAMLISEFGRKPTISVADFLNIPSKKYCVDIYPLLSITAQIQMCEEELEKRGLFEDFRNEIELYRVSEAKDGNFKGKMNVYPSYVVRMVDLVIGYVCNVLDDRFTILNLLDFVHELMDFNDYTDEDMDEVLDTLADIAQEENQESDEDDDMSSAVNESGLLC